MKENDLMPIKMDISEIESMSEEKLNSRKSKIEAIVTNLKVSIWLYLLQSK